MTRIAVLRERSGGEQRVAATPETVRKLIALGATVTVESGAGLTASIADEAYLAAGAGIAASDVAAGADIILAVQGPDPAVLAGAAADSLLLGILDPTGAAGRVSAYAGTGISA